MSSWVRVGVVNDVPVGTLKGVDANGTAIVLANVDGAICALRDECSHEAYPLSDGELDGGDLVCAYHGARFDACTGARKALPAVLPVRAFSVDVRDGEIYVEVDE